MAYSYPRVSREKYERQGSCVMFYLHLCLSFSWIINIHCENAVVVTPSVDIYDETPSEYTGRVIHTDNKTVIINGIVGEKVVLQCNVFNMPQSARIIWRRVSIRDSSIIEVINDGLMSKDMSRWKIGQGKQQNSVRLEILALDETYEGRYTCDCQYTGSVEPAHADRIIRVFAEPAIIRHRSSYDTDADVGDPVTLRCAADGIPSPVIYWQRTGGASSIIRNYGVIKNGNEILFEAVEADDAGEYMCIAENSMGRALWRVKLQVRHLPLVRIYPAEPRQKLACRLRLLCTIRSNPPVPEASCSWTSNRTGTLKSTSGVKLQYLNAGLMRQLVLDLNPVQAAYFGDSLTCTATNTLGVASASVTIQSSQTEVLLINGRHACGRASSFFRDIPVTWATLVLLLTTLSTGL